MTTQSGWKLTDRHSAIRGTGLAVHEMFTATGRSGGGTAGDFTLIIPYYCNPAIDNTNWNYHLLSFCTSAGVSEAKLLIRTDGDATFSYLSGAVPKAASAVGSGSSVGLHGMAVVTYDHSSGAVSLYNYRETVEDPISSATTSFVMDDMAATNQVCLGNSNNVGNTSNVEISLDSPVLGAVCRKDIMSEAQLTTLWNSGVAPQFSDLFPADVANMAWALGMHSYQSEFTGGSMRSYKTWDASTNSYSRLHYWVDTDGDGGTAWSDGSIQTSLIDSVDVNTAGAKTSTDVNFAAFFDPTADEGGIWQPGQPTASNLTTPISGLVPPLAGIIAGSRTGSTPVIATTFGNSRMALHTSETVQDGSPVTGLISLGYGFARARPARFGGYGICHLGINIGGGSLALDRYESGSPPAAGSGNINRLGFGSTSSINTFGPGETYSLATGDVAAFRFDTTNPNDDTTHDSQPFIVLVKRPEAGSCTIQTNSHTLDNSTVGTNAGTIKSSGALSTTTFSGTLAVDATDGLTGIVLTGDQRTLTVGDLIQFTDDDLGEIETVSQTLVGGNTALVLKHPVISTKASGTAINVGPFDYLYIGAGDIDEHTASASEWVGATVTSTGNVEVVCGGFYFTDNANAVCPIIMGHGGFGESEQLAEEFTGAWERFSTAVNADMAILAYGTQNETDLQASLVSRMGSLYGVLPVIGAPEGAYAGATFLADQEFADVVADARAFASATSNAALFSIYESGYDFTTACYAGHIQNGPHHTPEGSRFRNSLLWDEIESNVSALSGGGVSAASRLIAMNII